MAYEKLLCELQELFEFPWTSMDGPLGQRSPIQQQPENNNKLDLPMFFSLGLSSLYAMGATFLWGVPIEIFFLI